MNKQSLKRVAVAILVSVFCGAIALALVYAGSFYRIPQSDAQDIAQQSSQTIELAGMPSVAYLIDDEANFSRSLKSYLEALGIQADKATLIASPDGSNTCCYVSVGEALYKVEKINQSSPTYTFVPCSEPVVGINAPAKETKSSSPQQDKQISSSSSTKTEAEQSSAQAHTTPASPTNIAASDATALSEYFPADDAKDIPAIIEEFMDKKGHKVKGEDAVIPKDSIVTNNSHVSFEIRIEENVIKADYEKGMFGLELTGKEG